MSRFRNAFCHALGMQLVTLRNADPVDTKLRTPFIGFSAVAGLASGLIVRKL